MGINRRSQSLQSQARHPIVDKARKADKRTKCSIVEKTM